jgi:glycosyltransferase involved in cell wall biosynthesis
LARTLDYYTPSKLKSQVKSADVIIVERSPMHVIVMNRLVSDNSKSIIYSIHSLNRGEIHQKALDHSTALVSPSKETEESYERRYSIDCQKHIVKNGIHRDTVRDSFHTFKDRQLMRRYGIDDDTTVCLFVGSNFQENAEAANLLAEIANISNQTGNGVHALIVGEVGAAVEISGENITTTGYVDDLESHFDLADIGFNVIRRPDHGVSFKVMDYLARGIPVISSLQGAYGLDVTDRNEMVITDSFQPPELSKLLEEMDTDEILERLSVNGRGYLENNHLWEQKSKEFHEILENL